MGITNSIKSFFSPKEVKEFFVGLKGFNRPTVKSLIDSKEDNSYYNKKWGVKHPEDFDLLHDIYTNVPIVHGSIETTVDFATSIPVTILSDNQKVIDEAYKYHNKIEFEILRKAICRHGLIFGCAFLEKVGETAFKVLDPRFMYVVRDIHGVITGYKQVISKSKEPIEFKSDEIIMFVFNQIDDNPYGTSVLKPIMNALTQKLKFEKDVFQMLGKKLNAFLHVQMGSDEYPATETDIQKMTSDIENLSNANDFITNHLTKINVVGIEGKFIDIRPFVEMSENTIIYGLQVPLALLGRTNIPEGLARVQFKAFEKHIRSYNEAFERVWENKILQPYIVNKGLTTWSKINSLPELEFGEFDYETETLKLNNYMNVLRTPASSKTKVDAENKLRAILQFEGKVSEEDLQPTSSFGAPNDFKNPNLPDKNMDMGGTIKPGNQKKTKSDYPQQDKEIEDDYIRNESIPRCY